MRGARLELRVTHRLRCWWKAARSLDPTAEQCLKLPEASKENAHVKKCSFKQKALPTRKKDQKSHMDPSHVQPILGWFATCICGLPKKTSVFNILRKCLILSTALKGAPHFIKIRYETPKGAQFLGLPENSSGAEHAACRA